MPSRWYLVQTKARQEPLAERNLRRQAYTVFLPTEFRTVSHARRRRRVRSAFFPGYLFVSLDLSVQPWRSINSTYGVSRLVSVEHAPTPAPVGMVEELLAARDAEGNIALADAFESGDRVRVRTGPFEGFVGRVAAVPREKRLRVLLEFMNVIAPVEIDAAQCVRLAAAR